MEKENKQAEDLWKEINKIAIEAHELILKRVNECKIIDEKQNWLMFARVVNCVFYNTFKPSLSFSEDKINKIERNI